MKVWFFSVVFGGRKAGFCLILFFFARLPLLSSFEWAFVGALFVCVHWHSWFTAFISSKSRVSEAERKPKELIAILFFQF
jgi:hypothetical protein